MTKNKKDNDFKFNPKAIDIKEFNEIYSLPRADVNNGEQVYKLIKFNEAVLDLAVKNGKPVNVIEYIKESLADLQKEFDDIEKIPFIYDAVVNRFATSLHLDYIEKRVNENWSSSLEQGAYELINQNKNDPKR